MSVQSKPVKLSPFGAALAGALGGCFSTAVVYPLDVAKTRIQALPKGKNKDEQSLFGVMLHIFSKEGILGLYRGFGATMMNTFSMQYAYFFFYSMVRTTYLKRLISKLPKGSKTPQIGTAMELILGALAGALAQLFTIPVSVIATRQQVGKPRKEGEKEDVQDDTTFLGVAKEIVEEEGVTGLWLGLKPSLVLTVNPAITYGMFERVKGIVVLAQGTDKMSPLLSFLTGALSKTLATIVTYPYIMAKVRIQARSADIDDAAEQHHELPHSHEYHHKKYAHPGALDILGRVWKREGFVGWYQGMQAQIVKAVLSQALLFMSKDQFEKYAFVLMIVYHKLTDAISAVVPI
ncbi:mitochondrial carrier [Cylindrobasidium torrendii FP15055 ss-10]|uniref:Mitochondrial carrier n=1 Tax=Cylindrobasidium torrendii FP15055 ss-10 TaxID=1314674 RepID=A0A0D7AUH7_9AGAR|nr:mitochondrial carrier [Cylindrobasidium torrendii FP15055 ss-10]